METLRRDPQGELIMPLLPYGFVARNSWMGSHLSIHTPSRTIAQGRTKFFPLPPRRTRYHMSSWPIDICINALVVAGCLGRKDEGTTLYVDPSGGRIPQVE